MRHFTQKLALTLAVALLIPFPAVAAQRTVRHPEPKVWKIGVEGPLAGSQSDIGIGMVEGAQLAADEINAAGGVLGRQVQIIPIDDAADPAVGVPAAKAAIQAGLDGVVGPYNSGVRPPNFAALHQGQAGPDPPYILDLDRRLRRHAPAYERPDLAGRRAGSDHLAKNTSVAIIYDNSTAYTQGADTSLVAGLRPPESPYPPTSRSSPAPSTIRQ